MVTRIHIRKDRYKFSAAHMTVFEDGTKEALHGHNYETQLTIEVKGNALVPFSEFKNVLGEVTQVWDEKVLIAKDNPHFKERKAEKGGFAFTLCKKHYLIPKDEVVLLETDNVTSESLSQIALQNLLKALPSQIKKQLKSVTLRIEESKGQGASTEWSQK